MLLVGEKPQSKCWLPPLTFATYCLMMFVCRRGHALHIFVTHQTLYNVDLVSVEQYLKLYDVILLLRSFVKSYQMLYTMGWSRFM